MSYLGPMIWKLVSKAEVFMMKSAWSDGYWSFNLLPACDGRTGGQTHRLCLSLVLWHSWAWHKLRRFWTYLYTFCWHSMQHFAFIFYVFSTSLNERRVHVVFIQQNTYIHTRNRNAYYVTKDRENKIEDVSKLIKHVKDCLRMIIDQFN